MPVRSRSQVRKLAQLMGQGKISETTFYEYLDGVNLKNIPDRVGKKRRHR